MRISISLKLISVLALFLLSFVAGLPAYADVVRIGFDHPRPPYIISDATASNSAVARPTGIEIEIVRQAFAQVGMEVLALVAPLKRRIFNLKHGKLDAVATVIEGLKDVFYSDPYVEYQNFAITHVNKSIKLTEIADLANYKLAAWSGASGHLVRFSRPYRKKPLYTRSWLIKEIRSACLSKGGLMWRFVMGRFLDTSYAVKKQTPGNSIICRYSGLRRLIKLVSSLKN